MNDCNLQDYDGIHRQCDKHIDQLIEERNDLRAKVHRLESAQVYSALDDALARVKRLEEALRMAVDDGRVTQLDEWQHHAKQALEDAQ